LAYHQHPGQLLSLGIGTAAPCHDAHQLQQLLHATLQKGAASNQTLAVRTLSWKLLIQPSSSCIGGSVARVVASSLSMVSTEASSCSRDSSCSPQKDPGFLQGAHNKVKPLAEYCDYCLQQPPCTPTSALSCKQMLRVTGNRIHGQYRLNHHAFDNHCSTSSRVRIPRTLALRSAVQLLVGPIKSVSVPQQQQVVASAGTMP
jgi:hypothetical protein